MSSWTKQMECSQTERPQGLGEQVINVTTDIAWKLHVLQQSILIWNIITTTPVTWLLFAKAP